MDSKQQRTEQRGDGRSNFLQQLGSSDEFVEQVWKKIQQKMVEEKKPKLKQPIQLAHLHHLKTKKIQCISGGDVVVSNGGLKENQEDPTEENEQEFDSENDDLDEDDVISEDEKEVVVSKTRSAK